MDRVDQRQWGAKEVARLLTLVESERRYYQEILAILPTPIAVIDAELRLISTNRAFRNYFSLTGEDAPSRIAPGSAIEGQLARALESRQPVLDFTSRLFDKTVLASLAPLTNWEEGRELVLSVKPGVMEAPSLPASAAVIEPTLTHALDQEIAGEQEAASEPSVATTQPEVSLLQPASPKEPEITPELVAEDFVAASEPEDSGQHEILSVRLLLEDALDACLGEQPNALSLAAVAHDRLHRGHRAGVAVATGGGDLGATPWDGRGRGRVHLRISHGTHRN